MAATSVALFAFAVGMCWLAVNNYVETHGKGDISQEEILTHAKAYLWAALIGTVVAFFIHSKEVCNTFEKAWSTCLLIYVGIQVRRKVHLLVYGIVVMILTTDMRCSKSKQPDSDSIKNSKTNTKRIIFIRHGESLWNEAFNGSKLPHKFLYRTLAALFGELLLLPAFDSVLFDSPLNELGFGQAKTLQRSIETYPAARERSDALDRDIAALRGTALGPSSVVVSSNLRRAAQTAVVALWPRLKPEEEGKQLKGHIKILSQLQEVSRNVDTLSLTPAKGMVPLPRVDEVLSTAVDNTHLFNVDENHGNKPIFGTGLQRLANFCAWAHSQQEDVIICAGHSLWFKHFFNTYLPKSSKHDAKDCKMKNGAAVAFNLQSGTNREYGLMYRIDPDSITIVEGGFDNKKKKRQEKADYKAMSAQLKKRK